LSGTSPPCLLFITNWLPLLVCRLYAGTPECATKNEAAGNNGLAQSPPYEIQTCLFARVVCIKSAYFGASVVLAVEGFFFTAAGFFAGVVGAGLLSRTLPHGSAALGDGNPLIAER
jgi:hypothetical protein